MTNGTPINGLRGILGAGVTIITGYGVVKLTQDLTQNTLNKKKHKNKGNYSNQVLDNIMKK